MFSHPHKAAVFINRLIAQLVIEIEMVRILDLKIADAVKFVESSRRDPFVQLKISDEVSEGAHFKCHVRFGGLLIREAITAKQCMHEAIVLQQQRTAVGRTRGYRRLKQIQVMFRELVYLRRSAFKPDMEMHADRHRHSERSFPSFRLRIELKMQKNAVSLAFAISKQLRLGGIREVASAKLFHAFSVSSIVSQVWCGRGNELLERNAPLDLAQLRQILAPIIELRCPRIGVIRGNARWLCHRRKR
jgi:hypothetical protein